MGGAETSGTAGQVEDSRRGSCSHPLTASGGTTKADYRHSQGNVGSPGGMMFMGGGGGGGARNITPWRYVCVGRNITPLVYVG